MRSSHRLVLAALAATVLSGVWASADAMEFRYRYKDAAVTPVSPTPADPDPVDPDPVTPDPPVTPPPSTPSNPDGLITLTDSSCTGESSERPYGCNPYPSNDPDGSAAPLNIRLTQSSGYSSTVKPVIQCFFVEGGYGNFAHGGFVEWTGSGSQWAQSVQLFPKSQLSSYSGGGVQNSFEFINVPAFDPDSTTFAVTDNRELCMKIIPEPTAPSGYLKQLNFTFMSYDYNEADVTNGLVAMDVLQDSDKSISLAISPDVVYTNYNPVPDNNEPSYQTSTVIFQKWDAGNTQITNDLEPIMSDETSTDMNYSCYRFTNGFDPTADWRYNLKLAFHEENYDWSVGDYRAPPWVEWMDIVPMSLLNSSPDPRMVAPIDDTFSQSSWPRNPSSYTSPTDNEICLRIGLQPSENVNPMFVSLFLSSHGYDPIENMGPVEAQTEVLFRVGKY